MKSKHVCIIKKAFHLIFYFPKHFFSHMRKIACNFCTHLIPMYAFLVTDKYMQTFLDTEQLVSRNANISRHRTFGVQKCKHFSTPNVRCPEMQTFLDTKRSVSRNANFSRHQTFGVQKCKHFSTPNIRCPEMQTFLSYSFLSTIINFLKYIKLH